MLSVGCLKEVLKIQAVNNVQESKSVRNGTDSCQPRLDSSFVVLGKPKLIAKPLQVEYCRFDSEAGTP